jgi:hypothetical protein
MPDRVDQYHLYLQPFSDISLGSADLRFTRGLRLGNGTYVWGLTVVALLILVIACVNVTNLATAQALRRTREVGVRKTLGAGPGHVLSQLMTETLLLSSASMVGARGGPVCDAHARGPRRPTAVARSPIRSVALGRKPHARRPHDTGERRLSGHCPHPSWPLGGPPGRRERYGRAVALAAGSGHAPVCGRHRSHRGYNGGVPADAVHADEGPGLRRRAGGDAPRRRNGPR